MAVAQVHQKVVNDLMRDIFIDKLHAGEKLPPERELSKELDVDRTSLRVALKQLESMNLLDIRPGDGIYVKDFIKNAGIDFLRQLFSLEDEISAEIVADRYVIDEIWEWWAATFPEMIRLAARRFSARDLKALDDLLDRELEALDDPAAVVDIEIAEQDLTAQVANNMIMILISNSSRPMRRKIVDIFVRSMDRETLHKFIMTKKNLIRDFLLNPSEDVDKSIAFYRETLEKNRQLVRRVLSAGSHQAPEK